MSDQTAPSPLLLPSPLPAPSQPLIPSPLLVPSPLLILGRDVRDAVALLGRDGVECIVCTDLAALSAAISEDTGSVLATDESLARVDLDILTQRLALQPHWSDLPFIILTRRGASYRRALETLNLPQRLGNVMFLERPLTALSLISAVRAAMRARLRQRDSAMRIRAESVAQKLRTEVDERIKTELERLEYERELEQQKCELEQQTLELEQQKRELEQQKRELERSNADLEQFAYAASHDLQAPLRAIAHLSQWIDEDVRATASPDTLENLRLLNGRVARLQMLVTGLLDYARVGRVDLAAEDVDVAAAVSDVVAMLAPRPDFAVACEAELPVIRTYRTPFSLVLKNLISNAQQHHDRAQGRVTVAARLVDGMAEIRVTDDGPGIEARYHDIIFVIFKTLRSRDDTELGGMGLAMVKRQVTENGGQIWVESTPPARGTTFVFTWKLLAP